MARSTNALITFNDAQDMVSFDGFYQKTTIPTSNQCMTKTDIETYLYAYVDPLYPSNRLITYNNIDKGLYLDEPSPKSVAYTAGSFTFGAYGDYSYSVSDDGGWLSCTPVSDFLPVTITCSYDLNVSTTTRSATITVTQTTTGQTVDLVVNQAANPGIATDAKTLGTDTTETGACDEYGLGNTSTYYVPTGESFQSATGLYTNSAGTISATSGYYSDGLYSRYWNGSTFTSTAACGL